MFADVEKFVVSYLVPHVRRRLGGPLTWCAQWWQHEEAIARLNAIWLAWEHLRLDGPLGMSTWWLSHADPHLAVLLAKDGGPFTACRPDRHVATPPLPIDPAPAGIWSFAQHADREQTAS